MKNEKWTNDEDNLLIKYYPIYGIEYFYDKLNRSKRAIQSRRKHLGLKIKYTVKEKYYKKNVEDIVKNSFTYKECMIKLGINNFGSSLNTLKKYIKIYNLDISHFNNSIDILIIKNTKDINEWLQNGTNISSFKLKNKLYKEGLKEKKCEKCGQDEIWKGEKMSLILDHINGINDDNRIENLRIVCPNCNATLPTHCRGNKKLYEIKKKKLEKDKEIENNNGLTNKQVNHFYSKRKVERPSYKQLIKDIKKLGYKGTGKKYGVSDNSIRKWKKYYEKYN